MVFRTYVEAAGVPARDALALHALHRKGILALVRRRILGITLSGITEHSVPAELMEILSVPGCKVATDDPGHICCLSVARLVHVLRGERALKARGLTYSTKGTKAQGCQSDDEEAGCRHFSTSP